ncbi:MAG: DNA internalization-related competence protein ComEC/Rec2 [Methylomonas sp.]
MTSACLAFLLGVVAVQQLPSLPSPSEWLLSACVAGLLAYKRYWYPLFFLLGLLWAFLFGMWRMADQLPDSYQNADISVQGYIASLPQLQDQRVSFDFAVSQPSSHFPKKIRLNWYYPKQPIKAGQSLQLTVKLKKPHGRINPGGFDYEAWLFANHIGATGYVRDNHPAPQPMESSPEITQYFARWRQAISDRLDAALPDSEQLGIIKALTIGSQDAVSQRQWAVFRTTGTIHLIVISGSHISLVAGLVYLWVRRGWAWLGILSISPQRVAALIAWLAALFYAGLAGYSIPTLRAVVMLSVALAAIAWQRNTTPLQILLLALIAVLLFDPLAVLSVGFWLSFVAVALLIYVSSGRLGRSTYWREATLSQLATTIGLSPLLILFFQRVSLISPLANWLAIPVLGVMVVPMALLAVALLFVLPVLAVPLLQLCDWLLQALWRLLAAMADLPLASIAHQPPPWFALPMAGIGILLMLTPRGVPARYLSLFLFLPLIFVKADKPQTGAAWLTLLDVGQGLSAVVQTAQHSLVFDTGAQYAENFDMGDSVLLPFLRHQGIKSVDTLLISHEDNDHSGGAASLLADMPVDGIISSAPAWAERYNGRYCKTGQSWDWDGVKFSILSPPETPFATENENSCVLRVDTGHYSFLLTGDIAENVENWLVRQYGNQLNSTVLVAPHHGSNTGSSYGFLQQVKPRLVMISAGYLNRFGFPHSQVLARYRQLDLRWLNSAEQGAINLRANPDELQVESERSKRRRYWMEFSDAKKK